MQEDVTTAGKFDVPPTPPLPLVNPVDAGLGDPKNKEAFQEESGRPLDTPRTCQQLFDQTRFFNDPKAGLAGGASSIRRAGPTSPDIDLSSSCLSTEA